MSFALFISLPSNDCLNFNQAHQSFSCRIGTSSTASLTFRSHFAHITLSIFRHIASCDSFALLVRHSHFQTCATSRPTFHYKSRTNHGLISRVVIVLFCKLAVLSMYINRSHFNVKTTFFAKNTGAENISKQMPFLKSNVEAFPLARYFETKAKMWNVSLWNFIYSPDKCRRSCIFSRVCASCQNFGCDTLCPT